MFPNNPPVENKVEFTNRDQFDIMLTLAQQDVEVLKVKDKSYGSSWRKRGGTGAFHQGIARKWDRLETILQNHSKPYDIFDIIKQEAGRTDDGSFLDTMRDLRRYLFLIDAWILWCEQQATAITPFQDLTKDPGLVTIPLTPAMTSGATVDLVGPLDACPICGEPGVHDHLTDAEDPANPGADPYEAKLEAPNPPGYKPRRKPTPVPVNFPISEREGYGD